MAHLVIHAGPSRIVTNPVHDTLLAEVFSQWTESKTGVLLDISSDSATSLLHLPSDAVVEWHFDIKVPFDGARAPVAHLRLA